MIPSLIGCLGGRMKKLKSDLEELFDNEIELNKTVRQMQKNCSLGGQIDYLKSIVSIIVDMRSYILIIVYCETQ